MKLFGPGAIVTKFGLELVAGRKVTQEVRLLMYRIAFFTFTLYFLKKENHLKIVFEISPWEGAIEFIFYHPIRPEPIGVGDDRLLPFWVGHHVPSLPVGADQDVAFGKEMSSNWPTS